mmetsp:Transcript_11052/g.14799  ORF Transcript_11052/g.14799 Transcript_11052/m.14799 type:complete len:257 (-) Transcript_11052:249-1019(-)
MLVFVCAMRQFWWACFDNTVSENQVKDEFYKKHRKSDKFKRNLPEEKDDFFKHIVGSLFHAEAGDCKKEVATGMLGYEGLAKCSGEKKMDFSLKSKIDQENREADRCGHFATLNIRMAQHRGEVLLKSLPLMEKWVVQNNDEAPQVVGQDWHSWGTDGVLYKSVAIDALDLRYLLGAFETEAKCRRPSRMGMRSKRRRVWRRRSKWSSGPSWSRHAWTATLPAWSEPRRSWRSFHADADNLCLILAERQCMKMCFV